MIELLRILFEVFTAAPLATLGALWFAAFKVAQRMGVPDWMLFIAPIGIAYVLYKKRRHARRAIVTVTAVSLVAVWATLLWVSPTIRWWAGLALPLAAAFGLLFYLGANYPHLPPWEAVQFALAERWSREVVTDAVRASVGEGAKVLSVKPLDGGQFEAEVVGPAGVSHADLVESLRGSLAESILAQSGRVMGDVTVAGNGAKGAVKVRCSTFDPYRQTMRLKDMR